MQDSGDNANENTVSKKRSDWTAIALARVLSIRPQHGSTIASQILVELLVVPEEAIPDRPEEMWDMIVDYATWALSKGTEPEPEWYDDGWISEDW